MSLPEEWLEELDNLVALAVAAEKRADRAPERYGDTTELWRVKERLWELWPKLRAAVERCT